MSLNLKLDHIAINVKENMNDAYNLFSELGFTITPRGYHSLGSINHSMIFKNDYLELIGTQKDVPINRPELKNAKLGINGLVFKSNNIEQTYNHLVKLNYHEHPPRSFHRPVKIQQVEKEARFKTVSIKSNIFKAGRIYFCDHLTPNLVWLPEYFLHDNKSIAILEIVIIDSNPSSIIKKFLEIDKNLNVSKKDNIFTLKNNDFNISILHLSDFKQRYKNVISNMKFRSSMFGSIKLKMESLSFFKNIRKDTLKKIIKFSDKNKVQIFLKDYNLVLEFIQKTI